MSLGYVIKIHFSHFIKHYDSLVDHVHGRRHRHTCWPLVCCCCCTIYVTSHRSSDVSDAGREELVDVRGQHLFTLLVQLAQRVTHQLERERNDRKL